MDVIIAILQIVGWCFLAIVFLLVLALCMVLFAPMAYRVDGHALEDTWIRAKFHWLCYLIRGSVSYGDDLLYGEVWFLWKKFSFSKDFTQIEEEAEETEKDIEADAKEVEEEITGESKDASMISKIKGTIETIKINLPKIKKILNDEKNKKAVSHIKEEIFYLVKILSPKKGKMKGVYSTGSPDTTGQLLGVMSWMPIFYKDSCNIYPDFESEEMYFKGDFWCKGRFYGSQLVGIVLRILMDKNCRRMYAMLQAFKKSLNRQKVQEDK